MHRQMPFFVRGSQVSFYQSSHHQRNIDVTSGELIVAIAFPHPTPLTLFSRNYTFFNKPEARTNLVTTKIANL